MGRRVLRAGPRSGSTVTRRCRAALMRMQLFQLTQPRHMPGLRRLIETPFLSANVRRLHIQC
eukprot:15116098-Alexandrium_andersonii.AAC.1